MSERVSGAGPTDAGPAGDGALHDGTTGTGDDTARAGAARDGAAGAGAARDGSARGDGAARGDATGPGTDDGGAAARAERLADALAQLVLLFRRRASGDYTVDDYGFDRQFTEDVFLPALRPLAETWFRLEVTGTEHLPATGPVLVVANHSGVVALDALVVMLSVHDGAGRFLRPLAADMVFDTPVLGTAARRIGATLADHENAERLLDEGHAVGVFPEGFKGVGKSFSERYRLQRFGRGGFVAAALRAGAPIVPCSVVGAEEIYPKIGEIPALARLLGLPYFPVTPFFPWLGALGAIPLPSKWLIEFGAPIHTEDLGPGAADDAMAVFELADRVREDIQQTLYSLLIRRGPAF